MTDDTIIEETNTAPSVTDEVVPKKRGRKPKVQEESTLPLDDTPSVQAPADTMSAEAPVTPEDILRPILEKYRYSNSAPTLVGYVGSTIPKGMWMLIPVDNDTLEAAWRAYKARFGTADQDRFIRVVHSILGMAMDSTIRTVNLLRLE